MSLECVRLAVPDSAASARDPRAREPGPRLRLRGGLSRRAPWTTGRTAGKSPSPCGSRRERILQLACSTVALGTALSFLAMLLPASAIGSEDPIWRYDFRDVFYDAAFPNLQDAVIVGARGRVLVTHSRYRNLWCPRDSGTKELLTCLSFVNEREGWAAGHGGIVLHTLDTGRSWEILRESKPENQPLFAVQFLSTREGFACGAFDTFLKTTDGGKTWESLSPGLDTMYNGMAFLDPRNGYLAGEFGTVLHTSDGGLTWEKLDLGDHRGSWFGILLLSREEILVFGIAGGLMRSQDGGRTWASVPSPTDQSLFRGAANRDEVLLVGASGTILYSPDRGVTFSLRKDEDLTKFAGVCAHPAGGFLCVGETGKILHIRP